MHGLGSVLIQLYEGKKRLVQFASCTLVEAECNYAPIEGEPLAIFLLCEILAFAHGRLSSTSN